MNRKTLGWWVVSLLLSAGFLLLAIRNVRVSELADILARTSPGLLALAVIAGGLGLVVRALRWGVFFGWSLGFGFGGLFRAMMIGTMANNILPARAGELVRIVLLRRSRGVSRGLCAGTVVLERSMDAWFLLVLAAGVTAGLPLPPLVRLGFRSAGILFAVVGVVLGAMAWRGTGVATWVEKLVGRVSARGGQFAGHLLARFSEGLHVLRSFSRLLFVLLLTAAIWLCEAAVIVLVARALGIDLSWLAALFTALVIALSFVIPAAPGAIGTYEYFTVTALSPFGVSQQEALGLALLLHAVSFFTTTATGLVCLWAESLSLRDVMSQRVEE